VLVSPQSSNSRMPEEVTAALLEPRYLYLVAFVRNSDTLCADLRLPPRQPPDAARTPERAMLVR
jgi:hypothetical protein